MNAPYTPYHPKWHRERMPIFWWLKRWNYTKFITRELTSLAVAYTVLLLVAEAWSRARGASWTRFEEWLARPAVLAFHCVVLAFLLIHTVTWLGLAPRALVVRLGRTRVPDGMVLAGHYAAWIVASAFVAWMVLGG